MVLPILFTIKKLTHFISKKNVSPYWSSQYSIYSTSPTNLSGSLSSFIKWKFYTKVSRVSFLWLLPIRSSDFFRKSSFPMNWSPLHYILLNKFSNLMIQSVENRNFSRPFIQFDPYYPFFWPRAPHTIITGSLSYFSCTLLFT